VQNDWVRLPGRGWGRGRVTGKKIVGDSDDSVNGEVIEGSRRGIRGYVKKPTIKRTWIERGDQSLQKWRNNDLGPPTWGQRVSVTE